MKQSFYLYALKYRGGQMKDNKSQFADTMFHLHDFPKMTLLSIHYPTILKN